MKKILTNSLAVALGQTALFYPVLLLISMYILDVSPFIITAFFGLSVFAGSIAGQRLSKEKAHLAAVIFPALLAVLMAVLVSMDGRIIFLLALLIAAGTRGVYQMIRASEGRWETLLVGCSLIGAFALYTWALKPGILQPYAFSVYAAGTATLAVLLLRRNTKKVREALGLSDSEEIPSGRLLMINRGFMAVLLTVIIIIGGVTQFSVVLEWLYRLWQQILGFDFDSGTLPSEPPPESSGLSEAYIIPEEGEDDQGEAGWERWVIWGVAGIFSLAAATAIFMLLRWLYAILFERFPAWLKRLLANWRIAARPLQQPEQIAYADTTEKLDVGARKKVRRTTSKSLEPPEGPRRAYFRLVREAGKRGYQFKPGLTPAETGRDIADSPFAQEPDSQQLDKLIEQYNETRYSGQAKERNGDRRRNTV
ncbi:DUF4129 domain-containing protein [Saccharibacillus kuerlensis]|uniref:Protein-glutamine gamma-glutamyltransferase-like C-terminal domain-containing protein n=1 Tax=Saccharibacillus kuerlensis TaxID=459527 RepID=A0ABQ2KSY6_9BACL|nr:DUF4129 domain-containing protein [Saccharibacillus kuerlensis]GGN92413.1 hypothetical protein GCM10010969_04940 [Saccharibacillus kuerlensis]